MRATLRVLGATLLTGACLLLLRRLKRPLPSTPPAACEPAPVAAAPAKSPSNDAEDAAKKAADAAALAKRVTDILTLLEPTTAGSESRKRLVLELLEALRRGTECTGKHQRVVLRAFIDGEGPEILYAIESCMKGNWVADAKNGTMSTVGEIVKLPGPIGQAVSSYRRVAECAKLDAADRRCQHEEHQRSARS